MDIDSLLLMRVHSGRNLVVQVGRFRAKCHRIVSIGLINNEDMHLSIIILDNPTLTFISGERAIVSTSSTFLALIAVE